MAQVGVDLVQRAAQRQVHGATLSLLTTATGQKFGKSEGNAVWLDEELTSNYDFYQCVSLRGRATRGEARRTDCVPAELHTYSVPMTLLRNADISFVWTMTSSGGSSSPSHSTM